MMAVIVLLIWQLKRIRKALEDWPESEGEIKTLRGLGYQLSVYKN